ncbi:MAG: helix-turn-helix domain-containing protein [Bryobacteraceae bacterium]
MKEAFDQLTEHLVKGGFFLEEAVELLEKTMIARALHHTAGNRSEAAKLLGIHRNTLQHKMKNYHLDGRPPRRIPPQKVSSVRRRAAR